MSNVQDIYTANLNTPTIKDKLSDKFLGTSNVAMKQNNNAYEMNKAYTINQYEWNKQGMISAGINPLVNSSGLNNGVATGDSIGSMNNDAGMIANSGVEIVKNMLGMYVDKLNPREIDKKIALAVKCLV